MRIGINKPVTSAEETSQLNKHFFMFTQPENMLIMNLSQKEGHEQITAFKLRSIPPSPTHPIPYPPKYSHFEGDIATLMILNF